MGVILDRPTFDRLLVDHLTAALRFAIRLTNDPHDAEDIVQDAIVRATRSWQSFRGQSRFGTWFTSIVINVFRDRFRDTGEAEALPDDVEATSESPVVDAASAEFAALVASRVSSLPPRQREVLVLIVYEQMSIAEAATALETTEQNVRTNLHLARERMRRSLKRYAPELNDGPRATTRSD